MVSRHKITAVFVGLVCATGLLACQPAAVSSEDDVASVAIERSNDTVVARVDGTPIYTSDVMRAAEAQCLITANAALDPTDPIFRITVDELIDQRLLSRSAVKSGVSQDEEVQRRLLAARERILGNYRVETHLNDRVNDATILELYEAQRELAGRGEERRIRQIVVDDSETANQIAEQLAEEEDFETLAVEFSTDSATRERGGERGWMRRDMLSGALRTAVFTTTIGGRTAPINVQDEWYIIEVMDTRTPANRSFEEVREEIARFMTFEAIEDLLTTLRDESDIDRIEFDAPIPETDRDAEPAPDSDPTELDTDE